MADPDFAVVCYLPGKLGSFVDRLRSRFDPALAAWLAHVTILPPRPLQSPLQEPLETIRKQCACIDPFEATVRGVSTFWPVSGVVYLSFNEDSERLTQLHNALNCDGLAFQEPFPYIPHITIAQDLDQRRTATVMAEVEHEWARYASERSFRVESLFLVQHTPENRWLDLAPIPLGGCLAHSSR